MSQTIKARANIKLSNRKAVEAACNRLDLQLTAHGDRLNIKGGDGWFSTFSVNKDGTLTYDSDWRNSQQVLDEFIQRYAIEEQRELAAAHGYILNEHEDVETGDVLLELHSY